MPNPNRKSQSYRESQQKGSHVNITVTVPRPIAKMVHLHARIKNQTVSAMLREQLEINYKHLSRFTR
jgi:hypothetical protein